MTNEFEVILVSALFKWKKGYDKLHKALLLLEERERAKFKTQ